MAGGEHLPGTTENDDAHVIVGLRLPEGLPELNEQSPALGVPGLRPIEQDPHDGAVIERLPREKPVLPHLVPPFARRHHT